MCIINWKKHDCHTLRSRTVQSNCAVLMCSVLTYF
uniref:Uncharacterized protein n=1 Tax=Anguilla anguilla TaxID=7936 RepID=A0A0E9TNQ7_ANGAN